MCITSMCTFVKWVNPSVYDTYAFIDDYTPKEVLEFYSVHNIVLFPAHAGWPYPTQPLRTWMPHNFIKLQLHNWTRYESVFLFDSDIFF